MCAGSKRTMLALLFRLLAGRLLFMAYRRTAYVRLLVWLMLGVALGGLLGLKLVEAVADRRFAGAGSITLGVALLSPNLVQLARGLSGYLSLTVLGAVAAASGAGRALGLDVPWSAAVLVALGLWVLVLSLRPPRPPQRLGSRARRWGLGSRSRSPAGASVPRSPRGRTR